MIERRIARVRVNRLNSASPSFQRIARCKADRSSEKRWSTYNTASLFARNTSRHMVGSDAAMRVKSRKPPEEYLMTSDRTSAGSGKSVYVRVDLGGRRNINKKQRQAV